jgi:isopenicillin N synthase-like dioxygenase
LSAVHRVVPLEDLQYTNRHSIAYFLRPDDDAVYTNSNGAVVTAKEWHDKKFDVFRLTHDAQEDDTILCGGVEREERIIASA